jgi:hypothetical protein
MRIDKTSRESAKQIRSFSSSESPVKVSLFKETAKKTNFPFFSRIIDSYLKMPKKKFFNLDIEKPLANKLTAICIDELSCRNGNYQLSIINYRLLSKYIFV